MSNTDIYFLTGISDVDLLSTKTQLEESNVVFPSFVSKGYTAPVMQLNKQIYRKLGLSWSSLSSLPIQEIWLKDFIEKAVKTLSLLNKEEPLGICDPLLCRTLPVWTVAAHLLGIHDIRLLFVFEHPNKTVVRISEEHGMNVSDAHKLWINQVLDILDIADAAKSKTLPVSEIRFIEKDEYVMPPVTDTKLQNFSGVLYNYIKSVI